MNAAERGTIADLRTGAADLYRVCFVLTGQEDLSIEIAADVVAQDYGNGFGGDWVNGRSRKVAFAKALEAIRNELAASARRTEIATGKESSVLPALSVNEDLTRTDIDEALSDIDLFPRAAFVLLVFEKIRIADAISLLDADEALIRKAQIIALRRFANNIVRKNTLPTTIDNPNNIKGSTAC